MTSISDQIDEFTKAGKLAILDEQFLNLAGNSTVDKLISEKTYPEPQAPQRILAFYRSPLGQFCSGEYYVKTIPGGWETALAARRMLAARNRSELPDRAIPVPD